MAKGEFAFSHIGQSGLKHLSGFVFCAQPSLWSKIVSIDPKHLLVPVHDIRVDANDSARGQETAIAQREGPPV